MFFFGRRGRVGNKRKRNLQIGRWCPSNESFQLQRGLPIGLGDLMGTPKVPQSQGRSIGGEEHAFFSDNARKCAISSCAESQLW